MRAAREIAKAVGARAGLRLRWPFASTYNGLIAHAELSCSIELFASKLLLASRP